MEKRTFRVTLDIEASSEEQILNTYGLGKIIDARWCWDFEIEDPEKRHREVRIRRDKNFMGSDHFILESKWSDEPDDEWGIEEAYEVDDCDKINYHILGKIKAYKRDWGITPVIMSIV